MEKKETLSKFTKKVESTIKTINKVKESVPYLVMVDCIDQKKFNKIGFDLLVSKVCFQKGIDEDHIRKVAGWPKK